MGIRTLTKWLQWVRKTPQPVDWSRYRGHRIGVDILSFMYRSKHMHETPLQTIADLISVWRIAGVEPVVVFDGKTPQEKQCTRIRRQKQKERLPEEERPRVSADERNEMKQFLYMCGVLSLNAEHEADTVLAYLARAGHISAVVSSDLDFLARGVPHLICPLLQQQKQLQLQQQQKQLQLQQQQKQQPQWEDLCLESLLQESALTYDQFVSMCVLLGCDYAPVLPTISYMSAYWAIRKGHTMEECLEREGIRTTTVWETARNILIGEQDNWCTMLSDRQRQKWADGAPSPEPEALYAFIGPDVASSLLPPPLSTEAAVIAAAAVAAA
jgi:5'-3' exonuclease